MLRGAGIDAELPGRFRDAGDSFLPMVFGAREAARLGAEPDPAAAFCTAFCCKEALFKAAGIPIDPRECEWFPGAGGGAGRLDLSPALAAELGATRVDVRTWRDGDAVVAVVHVFGEVP